MAKITFQRERYGSRGYYVTVRIDGKKISSRKWSPKTFTLKDAKIKYAIDRNLKRGVHQEKLGVAGTTRIASAKRLKDFGNFPMGSRDPQTGKVPYHITYYVRIDGQEVYSRSLKIYSGEDKDTRVQKMTEAEENLYKRIADERGGGYDVEVGKAIVNNMNLTVKKRYDYYVFTKKRQPLTV